MKRLSVFALLAVSSFVFAKPQMNPSSFFSANGASAEFDLEAFESAFNLESKKPSYAPEHPCAQVKLTADQHVLLKKAFLKLKRTLIQDKADLDIAKLDYMVALSDKASTKAAATTASDTLAAAVGDITKTQFSFVNDVVFDILTNDQREPALACMAFMHHVGMQMKLKKMCEKVGPKKGHDGGMPTEVDGVKPTPRP